VRYAGGNGPFGGRIDLAQSQQTLLDQYLGAFAPLIGDKRTDRAFRGTVQGIIGAESLLYSRSQGAPPCQSPAGTERF